MGRNHTHVNSKTSTLKKPLPTHVQLKHSYFKIKTSNFIHTLICTLFRSGLGDVSKYFF